MRSGRLRTRSFVMGLIAWCALSLAPVVVLSPPLPATFLLLAVALAVCATLAFSLLAGAVVAVAGACLFGIALALLQAPAQASFDPFSLVRSFAAPTTALPAMLGLVALAGAVAFGELVSMGLEWDSESRRAGGPGRQDDDGSGDPWAARVVPRRIRVNRRRR